ncbi:MAG: hypothetical protein U1E56_14280 [Bauldia sp.]
MTIAVETDVRRVIGPEREAKLISAHDLAWKDWLADGARYSIWARTRANMFFERLAAHLQVLFADDKGARFVFHDETIKIVFDERVAARCKKANGQGFGSNVGTQANLRFIESEPDLFDLALQKVEVVYSLNDIGTKIKSIVIQARDGLSRLWAYALERPAASGMAPVVPLPSSPTQPASDATELVQPKKSDGQVETNRSEK